MQRLVAVHALFSPLPTCTHTLKEGTKQPPFTQLGKEIRHHLGLQEVNKPSWPSGGEQTALKTQDYEINRFQKNEIKTLTSRSCGKNIHPGAPTSSNDFHASRLVEKLYV